jgi:cell division protein FtsB
LHDLADELSSPSDKIWSKLNLLFGSMIAVVVGVTILYQSMPVSDEKKSQEEYISKLAAEIEVADMQNKRLTRVVDALQRDPEYVGIIARDRLGLMRDGETILRLDDSKKR